MADLSKVGVSLRRPGIFTDIDVCAQTPPPDLPQFPDVTVAVEVQTLLLHYFSRRLSGPSLLREMGAYATNHVRRRGIAERVELHPQKRCGCRCAREERTMLKGVVLIKWRQICPQLVPKYPNDRVQMSDRHGMAPVTCACGGCTRGHAGIDGCRWLEWVEPVLEVIGDP